MDKTYKITHRDGWSGKWKSALEFIDGVAFTSDPAFLAYFHRHSNVFTIDEINEVKQENDIAVEKPKKKTTRKKKEVKSDD